MTPTANLAASLRDVQAVLHGISRRLGPIVAVHEHRASCGFGLYVATATVKDPGSTSEIIAAGGSIDRSRTLLSAVGEAIERLCLVRPDHRKTLRARHREIADEAMDPRLLLHYPQSVYANPRIPLRPFDPEDQLFWVAGTRLSDGASIWVPTFAVFLNVSEDEGIRPPPDIPLSTGAACGRTWEEAVLKGLYEVIERDAFTIHWENRWPGQPLEVGPSLAPLLEALENTGFRLILRRLESDTRIPVVLAVLLNDLDARASLALGASASRFVDAAAYRAVEEAMLTSFWITTTSQLRAKDVESLLLEMEGFPNPESHARLYGHREMRSRASFLWQEELQPTVEGYRETVNCVVPDAGELTHVINAVRHTGCEPIAIDVTRSDLHALGLRVVRVIVPGFVPLPRGIHARPLANQRLRGVPSHFGQPALTEGFNSDPHPFP